MSKRRRASDLDEETSQLHALLHRGGVSMKGLADLLTTLRGGDGGCSAERWRAILKRANTSDYPGHRCIVDVPLTKGGNLQWEYMDPCKLVATMVRVSPGLQSVYTNAWLRTPSSPARPWSLVVGFDEFTPGNKLSVDASRKTMVVSVSFLELGQAAMSSGVAWCTCICTRTNVINEVFQSRCVAGEAVAMPPQRIATLSLDFQQCGTDVIHSASSSLCFSATLSLCLVTGGR